MKMGAGVEWMVHACITLACAPAGAPVQAGALAEFHGLPKAYLAKQLQSLVRAGILRSTPGVQGGFSLARTAGEISLMDIVVAVEGPADLFQCTGIRDNGVGAQLGMTSGRLPCIVQIEMSKAEMAMRKALAARTIAHLIESLDSGAPKVLGVTREWLQAL
ncbi:RrF2 family transcriptional regulator [Kitasatospora sp. NPDC059463]|uniref:RrF2 family transcriptional regulator n=1 Tax=unclassified Kitasatospora TaxID=2633591 RepID=UPI0036871884